MRRRSIGALLLTAGLVASSAVAVPRVGARLPAFEIEDLTGRVHSTRELSGRRTLVVAITETGASETMSGWSQAAERRLAPVVHRVWMVLLDLAFFIPTSTARSRAQERTPQGAWADTWLDVHNDKAEAADLPGSGVPWAFALDASGTIVVAFHGAPNEPGAESIWRALQPDETSAASP